MRQFANRYGILGAVMPAALAVVASGGTPFTTASTYQGQLKLGGVPLNATCDFAFSLWDGDNDPDPGTKIGSTIPLTAEVGNGLFQVHLDFGSTALSGEARWLEIDVCCPSPCTPDFTALTPRQELTPAPYALFALDGGSGGDADTLGSFLPRELVPAGAMLAFGGSTAPNGWLLCDGSAVSRTTCADLFAALGTAYGNGDGSTTFHLPGLRGRFLRGVSGGTANDPNRNQRTASNSGGNTGDNVGSLQTDATSRPNSNFSTSSVTNHTHSISSVSSHVHSLTGGTHAHFASMRDTAATGGFPTEARAGEGGFRGALTIPTGGGHDHSVGSAGGHAHSGGSGGGHGHSINSGGDSETRPVNIYVHWIIKH